MRKVIALIAAATAVAALGGASAVGAEPDSGPEAGLDAAAVLADTGQGKLVWESCHDEATPALECAMLDVPVDYSDPHGRKIRIKLDRLPATAPKEKRQGPILLNPGGPGISGLWMPASISAKLPADVASTYDWIGFDPRGTNGSEPHVVCDPHYFDGERPDYQVGQGTAKAWLKKAAGYASDCAADWSWLLPHMTTVDSARDMDSIRRALGEPKINFYGGSWGTSLGSTYGQLFPSRVRRMVLDSIVGPTISWYEHNKLQDKEHQRRFEAFTAWTAKADDVYHLGTDPAAVRKAYDQVEAADRPGRVRGHLLRRRLQLPALAPDGHRALRLPEPARHPAARHRLQPLRGARRRRRRLPGVQRGAVHRERLAARLGVLEEGPGQGRRRRAVLHL
ncbi:alpha/beta fold hydrolase [Kitasatospora sp. NPDC093806]|uniref:alpha/beta fold hydrolase n=1 Tax=Kitasatospora sp. NPDC093806 TaxID=3155075 RepID=UPI0034380DCC